MLSAEKRNQIAVLFKRITGKEVGKWVGYVVSDLLN